MKSEYAVVYENILDNFCNALRDQGQGHYNRSNLPHIVTFCELYLQGLFSVHLIYISGLARVMKLKYSYSPNGRFLVKETFPKTLPRFVLILISLQRWQHRVRKETKHFVSPHLIGLQLHQHDSASK